MITTILYLIWIAYAVVSGNFEAKYWYLRNYAHNPLQFKTEHIV